jgi:alkylation response protein AidB-like acyl-CoA dehydrogenase
MDLAFTADQDDLRAAVRKLLTDRLPPHRVAEVADGPGVDTDLWERLVALGWVSLSAPTAGGTFLDDAVLLEECGYTLAPVPLLSTVVAQPAVDVVAQPAAGDGDVVATAVAWAEPSGLDAFDIVGEPATVWEDDLISGEKVDVPDLGGSQRLVVVAAAGRGGPPRAFVTPTSAPGTPPTGAAYELLPTIDGSRRVASVTLAGTPAVAGPADAVVRMRRRALAALALESVGIAQRALDLAAEHANRRQQFGRAIGGYQAVAHRIADVYVATELARSLAYRAAWFVDTAERDGLPDAEVEAACSAAKAAAGDAGVVATEALVQVLGGIGMTWDHLAHRLYKRALANRAYAGLPSQHRQAIATYVLEGP